jgi:hypothetical protein
MRRRLMESRRTAQRAQPVRQRDQNHIIEPWLYSRAQTARLLNVSTATLVRLEGKGLLHAVKLGGSPLGGTYYAASEIKQLIGGDRVGS